MQLTPQLLALALTDRQNVLLVSFGTRGGLKQLIYNFIKHTYMVKIQLTGKDEVITYEGNSPSLACQHFNVKIPD